MYYAPPTSEMGAPPRGRRGPLLWVTSTLVGVILLAGASASSYLIGADSRPSDGEIKQRLVSQSTTDRRAAEAKLDDALLTQRKSLTKSFRKRLKKATELSFADGQAAGYGAGHAAGYGSGAAQGRAQGKQEGKEEGREEGRVEGELDGWLQGFDDGTCYDPDDYEYVC